MLSANDEYSFKKILLPNISDSLYSRKKNKQRWNVFVSTASDEMSAPPIREQLTEILVPPQLELNSLKGPISVHAGLLFGDA